MTDRSRSMNQREIDRLITALRLAESALWEVSSEAGDIPYWNQGGFGFKAHAAVQAALAQAVRDRGK